ncbi:SAM-dependent methyltransferase [Thermoproteota archaeon]
MYSINNLYYSDTKKRYFDRSYNKSGLFDWEKRVIEKYYTHCKKILVVGAGGGREVLALRELGYDADGFECNPELVKCANDILESEGFPSDVKLVGRDGCPDAPKNYDGAIVGWSAYMLIQHSEERIVFLKKMRALMYDSSPILVSFFYRCGSERYFKAVAVISNVIRTILMRKRVEAGDDLVPNHVHYFTKNELELELNEGGFNMDFYSTVTYGHAVGLPA